MVTDDQKRAFAARLNEALDDIGFAAKGAGRQGALGERMRVSQKGARKWLEGESIPTTARMMELAQWLNVNFEWLAMARGEKARASGQAELAPQAASSGTSYAVPQVVTAVSKILAEIDGQHRLSAISDDDATLLRAALRATQGKMSPAIRAAILLMLDSQNPREEVKNTSNPPFNNSGNPSHSNSDKTAASPAAFARSARADIRSAAELESDDQHDTGKHGT